ncbi:redoxin domain-containing protein [Fontisphaera persica]|uniref:TlpA disulfide reductase family protein n=1 Tax=Fontisphaera persica TaxID=2974023 RepID=UPI0024C01EEF|nr:redoxin domain-containing protein [Fontisphaera persica]WCJ60026.1 redoxin domain-containing protein [Fontisphaera persica]
MKKILTSVSVIMVTLCLGSWLSPLAAAELGDKAASLSIAKWIKGQSVDVTDGKNIYVVEFWATWCPPCRASIPHLTKLQKKFADKGVVFVGISDEDEDTVKPFVTKMGEQMDYRVAIDDNDKTSKAYMAAFGINGIPHAFIVDKGGRIVWHGHPMADLEKTLQAMVDGKYDLEKAKKRIKAQKLFEQFVQAVAEGEEKDKVDQMGKELEALDKELGGVMPDGTSFKAAEVTRIIQFQMLLEKYDEALEENPASAKKMEAELVKLAPKDWSLEEHKTDAQFRKDFTEYYAAVGRRPDKLKAASLRAKLADSPSKNAGLLNDFSWAILTDRNVKERDIPLALLMAEKAVKYSGGTNASVLDTYARALFDSGKKEEAIKQQKLAIKHAKSDDEREMFEENLKNFEK